MKKDGSQPIATNPDAASADKNLPAFLARPEGAPVYHGFRVLDDVVVDGFTLGMISDFLSESATEGDLFVIAPDNSRAGIVWEMGSPARIAEIRPFENDRWGVWNAWFELPMNSKESARRNLASILPELQKRWKIWKEKYEITHDE